jgi:hypothetical protein
MGCAASGPIPPTSLPHLIGTWVNTSKALQMDPDLGGASSPVRIKSITVRDGKFLYRRGNSPCTDIRPSATDRIKVWVRLSIHKDGRVQYEQLDYQGNYFILDFPVNTPWKEGTNQDTNDNDGKLEVTRSNNTTADGIVESESGSMEYRNCLGQTRARINFEFLPSVAVSSEHHHAANEEKLGSDESITSTSTTPRRRSALRVTPYGEGKSHTLVRKQHSSRYRTSGQSHSEERS